MWDCMTKTSYSCPSVEVHYRRWDWTKNITIAQDSLVPRPLPCFQCYTQKKGRAWYTSACMWGRTVDERWLSHMGVPYVCSVSCPLISRRELLSIQSITIDLWPSCIYYRQVQLYSSDVYKLKPRQQLVGLSWPPVKTEDKLNCHRHSFSIASMTQRLYKSYLSWLNNVYIYI